MEFLAFGAAESAILPVTLLQKSDKNEHMECLRNMFAALERTLL